MRPFDETTLRRLWTRDSAKRLDLGSAGERAAGARAIRRPPAPAFRSRKLVTRSLSDLDDRSCSNRATGHARVRLRALDRPKPRDSSQPLSNSKSRLSFRTRATRFRARRHFFELRKGSKHGQISRIPPQRNEGREWWGCALTPFSHFFFKRATRGRGGTRAKPRDVSLARGDVSLARDDVSLARAVPNAQSELCGL